MEPSQPIPRVRQASARASAILQAATGVFVAAAIVAVLALTPAHAPARAIAASSTQFALNLSARQAVGGYTPQQIQTAYSIAPRLTAGIDGTGQKIALLEFDRFAPADVDQFDSQFSLPPANITTTYQGGTPFTLPLQGEADMDIEWAHALAPGAAIQVYYLKNQSANAKGWKSVAAGIDAALAGGATSISLSFGACAASTGYTPAQQAFARALAHNVSVFVSSGDDGALAGPVRDCGSKPSVSYPASDPSVVGVGGTSLLLDDSNVIAGELAWRLSGGGKGNPLLRPSWQVTPNLKPGKYRYSPDVAFLGNPSTGATIVYRGRTQTAGGTSLGAPAWAAIWALIKEDAQHAGKTVPAGPAPFYRIGNSSSYGQAFNDVTRGNNGVYQAAAGWDAVTGWGTPIVSGLASTLLTLSSGA